MKNFLLPLLLVFSLTTFAQEAQIQKDFQTIIGYTHRMEIDKVLDMTYPPIFKVMPKEQMSAMAKGALTSMGIKTIYEQTPLALNLSPVKKLANASICLGKYNQSMVLESSQPSLLNMIAGAKMKDNTIERIGTNKLRIKGKNYLLAIKDANTKGGWKYLKYDEDQEGLNSKVLSKEIQTAANLIKPTLK